ncbi:MAG: TetR/AcrR family transcriptional regulator [Lachnospiraceae bacterium]|nr:TetR/AcrR family transcriptional regulator [Lachnospiraceae bacterium]
MSDSSITKKALADALKKLMKKKGFDRVSVSDICNSCGMNRKSFYYHFRDKYDLVNWVFYEDLIDRLSVADYENGWDMLYDICSKFYEDRVFYAEAFRIEGQDSFRSYVLETLRPMASFFLEGIFPDRGEEDYFFRYFGEAGLFAVMCWLRDDEGMTPEEFVENLRKVFCRLAAAVTEEKR